MAAATDPRQDINMTIEDMGIEELEEIPEPDTSQLNVIEVKREDTRGSLALVFLIGFFLMLFVGLLVAATSAGDRIAASTEILLTISGILSGPLGFVVGYYFRSQDQN